MNCGCNNNRIITPDCDMSRWEVECSSYIENADNYYTKPEIDEMLDEIESAITSGCCITPEEVDEKIAEAVSGKQDTLSAGTNIVISGNVISASGCECDLSDYYTKEQVDQKIPSLSGYATEQWVLDKHYITGVDLSDYVTFEDMGDIYTKTEVNNLFVTKTTFNTYITNLQQQINSLIESISGCCGSTGETEYRWIVVPNDYTCSGTTKMTKEKQQSSTDGINWTDTGQYRTGSTVLEYNSTDCGYVPPSEPQYRWKAAPTSDYLCIGLNKYYKVYYEVSYDNGATWQHVQPEQTKRGNLIEANSTDCGYSPTIKFYGVRTYGNDISIECNSSSTLTMEEVGISNMYTTVNFGSCLTSIDEKVFLNQVYLNNVVIPSNIISIGRMGFANCAGMTSLTLNEGLVTLGEGAFKACTSLSRVVIPNSVNSLLGDTFYTNNIKTLIIGSGVTSIGASCFGRSSSVTGSTVTIYATTPPSIVNDSPIFSGWNDFVIYVPAGSVNAYKAANGWSRYADKIQAIP